MKQLIIIALMLCSTANAQIPNFDTFISFGIDPKMATKGPYPDRPDNKPSFDYEISLGIEYTKVRAMMQLKSHQEINFLKWTYIQIDYKQKLLNNLYGYAGLEMAQIRKSHPDAHYSDPSNYRKVTTNPILFGANIELQYKLFNNRLGIAIQASMYQAEDEQKQYEKYRKDVTATLFFYL